MIEYRRRRCYSYIQHGIIACRGIVECDQASIHIHLSCSGCHSIIPVGRRIDIPYLARNRALPFIAGGTSDVEIDRSTRVNNRCDYARRQSAELERTTACLTSISNERKLSHCQTCRRNIDRRHTTHIESTRRADRSSRT